MKNKPLDEEKEEEVQIPYAAWIRNERESRGWSQRRLANEVGLTNTTISEAEKGKASRETLFILAAYFKKLDKVLTWAKDETTKQLLKDWNEMNGDEQERTLSFIRLLRL